MFQKTFGLYQYFFYDIHCVCTRVLKGSGNFVVDPLEIILDLAHAAMIIINLKVSQELNTFTSRSPV